MKKFTAIFLLFCFLFLFTGCKDNENAQILATTKPLYQFSSILCEETPLEVSLLVNENVSCLHDYSLQVSQMRMLESAELIVINGAGFEDFLADALPDGKKTIDCSAGIDLYACDHHKHEDHLHEQDPHIWLSIPNAEKMSQNIYTGLCNAYPEYAHIFAENLIMLNERFAELEGKSRILNDLVCRDLITFHDGFTYLADNFDLYILKAIEEESGAESSAHELIEVMELIRSNNVPAIFTETSSASSAASIIAAETGVAVYELDMGLSDRDYFEAMEHNIQTLKEALE